MADDYNRLVIGDVHFDAYTDDWYMDQLRQLFKKIFQIVDEREVEELIFVGDFFDKNATVNVKSLYLMKEIFLTEMEKRKPLIAHFIVGNHEIVYKNTTSVNSVQAMLGHLSYIRIYDKPESYSGMSFIPWICRDNYEEIMQYVANDTNKICFGHFQFIGFSMSKNGIPVKSGISHTFFSNYDKVITGHFHTKSYRDNVIYTGSSTQETKDDLNDMKTLFLLTRGSRDKPLQIEEIPVGFEYFIDIQYNGSDVDLSNVTGKYVFLTIHQGVSEFLANKIKDTINDLEPKMLRVINNNIIKIDTEEVIDEVIKPKSAMDLISETIEKNDFTDSGIDPDILKEKFLTVLNGL